MLSARIGINQTPRLQELWLTFPTIKIAFFPVPKNCPVLTKHPWITSYTNDIPNLLLSLLAFIWMERDDWYFGVDMGIYCNPDEPAIIMINREIAI